MPSDATQTPLRSMRVKNRYTKGETITQPWWREKYNDPSVWPIFEDFRVFLRLCWKHLNLPEPTPVQLDIAYYLQHGPRRLVIEAFRGVGKSWITSAFVCWLLLVDAQLNILVVSASKERSDQFTTFTMRLIGEMPILKHLYPNSDQRNSKIAFDVAPAEPDHAPSVKSVGVLGQMAGSRADIIVADDVEVPNNSETPLMRDKLSERVKEFDAILKPKGRVLYLGTPQTEESLYAELPERGYEVRMWPAQYPNEDEVLFAGNKMAPTILKAIQASSTIVGQPLDPRRFDLQDLLERRCSYGSSGYALQFMLDTRASDADRYPLKLSDLIVMDIDNDLGVEKAIWGRDEKLARDDVPCVGFNGDRYYEPMDFARDGLGIVRRLPYKGCVMAIDPAGRGKDETAWAVIKMLNSQMFLIGAGGFRDGYTEKTLVSLAMTAKLYKVNEIIVEPNFGDGMFTALLLPYLTKHYPVTCAETERSNVQKEKRIVDTLEPVMNQHRLIIDRKLIERDYKSTQDLPPEDMKSYRLMYQMSRITYARGSLRHEDRLDAVQMAVAYWVEAMSLDAGTEIEKHEQEWKEKELRKFMDHASDPLGRAGERPPGHAGGQWM